MTRRSRVKRRGDKHVRLHQWLMNSPAWKSLDVGPRALLIELYTLFNGDNNGDVFLSEREAGERLNCHRQTAAPWFADLQERGFIWLREKGSFHLKSRHASRWILTEFPYNGDVPTRDFMRWQGPAKIQSPRRKFHPDASKISATVSIPGRGALNGAGNDSKSDPANRITPDPKPSQKPSSAQRESKLARDGAKSRD